MDHALPPHNVAPFPESLLAPMARDLEQTGHGVRQANIVDEITLASAQRCVEHDLGGCHVVHGRLCLGG
jgi:hypothetical protein